MYMCNLVPVIKIRTIVHLLCAQTVTAVLLGIKHTSYERK